MKKPIKIYLEGSDEADLKIKAEECGFIGRGAVSHFIEKICREPIIFMDKNAKSMLKALALK